MEYIELGNTPLDEGGCVQISDTVPYAEDMKAQCRQYLGMLERFFSPPPGRSNFRIKRFESGWGPYWEVVIMYDPTSQEETDFALDVDANLPGKWFGIPQA